MINAVEARTLARSIVEARKEGRKLKPLSNTKLMSATDAVRIQDAVIELRQAANETLVGWALIDASHVAPVMSGAVVDDRVVMGIPSQAVDVRVEPVVVFGEQARLGLRAMDRLITGGITEDAIASGHGLVSLASGEELPPNFESGLVIKVGRTQHEVKGGFAAMRAKVEELLRQRGRSLSPNELVISTALLPGVSLERGQEHLVRAQVDQVEVKCALRHL